MEVALSHPTLAMKRKYISSVSDLCEDAVISGLYVQEALYVAAGVSVRCGGTTGGAGGPTGQTGKRWWLWGSCETKQ